MTEAGSNLEFSAKLIEEHGHPPESRQHAVLIEIVEAIVLALVALSSAWSGYQAAKWGGISVHETATAIRQTVVAQEKTMMAGQERVYDVFAFNYWLTAKAEGNEKLAAFYERRFRPEYVSAFVAWQKLDPLHNSSAPPGPVFMPEYVNENSRQSVQLTHDAQKSFEKAAWMRGTSDEYVRVTVLLATVLLLTAISQRMRIFWPRRALVTIAVVMLCASTYHLLVLPRA